MITYTRSRNTGELLVQVQNQALSLYEKLSSREKIGLAAIVVVIVLALASKGVSALSAAFNAQSRRLKSVVDTAERLPDRVGEYTQLRARKAALEKQYQQVEITEPLTYLESLLNQKDGIQKPFVIEQGKPAAFGKAYEQVPFLIKFGISNYGQLIELLKELSQGKKPMIMRALNLTKIAGGRQIQAQLEVTSIRRVREAK